MARSWQDTRSRITQSSGADRCEYSLLVLDDFDLVEVREMRERRGLTEQDVADWTHVSQSQVIAIEKGEVLTTEVGTIERYVTALGGKLEIVADFDGDRLILS